MSRAIPSKRAYPIRHPGVVRRTTHADAAPFLDLDASFPAQSPDDLTRPEIPRPPKTPPSATPAGIGPGERSATGAREGPPPGGRRAWLGLAAIAVLAGAAVVAGKRPAPPPSSPEPPPRVEVVLRLRGSIVDLHGNRRVEAWLLD